MKIRNGFVSNSSSSSFVIPKHYLSGEQIDKINNYIDIVEDYLKDTPLPKKGYYDYDNNQPKYDFSYYEYLWTIKDFGDYIFGSTSMDNFDFHDFLKFIGVKNENAICWDDGWNNNPTDEQTLFLKTDRKILRKKKLNKLNKDK